MEINEKKDYIDKLSTIYDNDLRNMKFPEIFTHKNWLIIYDFCNYIIINNIF